MRTHEPQIKIHVQNVGISGLRFMINKSITSFVLIKVDNSYEISPDRFDINAQKNS